MTALVQSSNLQAIANFTSSQPSGMIQPMQMLNQALLIKLDTDNYNLWQTQMENVIFANGFEEHIEGLKVCPSKATDSVELNPEFISWRQFDRMILSWIYSSLTPEIMATYYWVANFSFNVACLREDLLFLFQSMSNETVIDIPNNTQKLSLNNGTYSQGKKSCR